MKKTMKTLMALTLIFALVSAFCIGANAAIEDKWNLYCAFYDGAGILTEDLDDETNGFVTAADENGAINITYPAAGVRWWPCALVVSKEAAALDGASLKAVLSMTDTGWGANSNITFSTNAPEDLPIGGAAGLYCSDGILLPEGSIGFSLLFRGDNTDTVYKRVTIIPHGFALIGEYTEDSSGAPLTDAAVFESAEDITISVEEDATLGYKITLNGQVLKFNDGTDLDLTGLKDALAGDNVYTSVGCFAPGTATGGLVLKEFNGAAATDAGGSTSSEVTSSEAASSEAASSQAASSSPTAADDGMMTWIIVGIALVVVAGGVVVFLVVKGKGKKK